MIFIAVNKIIFAGQNLLDLTQDTVEASVLKNGYTTHNSFGEKIEGSLDLDEYLKENTFFDNLRLRKGQTTKLVVNLACSDGTPYVLKDDEKLTIYLWYGEDNISLDAINQYEFEIAVPSNVDYPFYHYDVYFHSGENMYLSAYGEAEVSEGDSIQCKIDGLISEETKVCTSISEWKRTDYALVDVKSTTANIDASIYRQGTNARSIRLPQLTTIPYSDTYLVGLTSYAPRLSHVEFTNAVQLGGNTYNYNIFMLDTTIKGVELPKLQTLEAGMMNSTPISYLDCPSCTSVAKGGAPYSELTSVRLPECTALGESSFSTSCLANIYLPKCKTIGVRALSQNPNLEKIELPSCVTLGQYSFAWNPRLKQIILPGETLCAMSSSSDITDAHPDLKIYVNDNLVDAYKNATNWSGYASKIRPISDLS